ncbi:PAS domain S-box protein [Natrarchaeobius oligotrophus]|uniref:histidine kinase n=1 Tax=Natrarchaeobius chitinivorans TaxID=1679083 RepID=A0A3N6LW45_NATCH|nr:PAS domain S-box protein [Natrarchaeobius chitinivorans]RQG94793.1 PAS domain S-box protein [Natrarchaeobius chitinivorans]
MTVVLYVDGDAPRRSRVIHELEERLSDVRLLEASSVRDGLEVFDGESPDCIVSTYELPDRDGVSFLRRVRETSSELPFVLFVADGSEAIASEAVSAGVTDYVRMNAGGYERLAERIRAAIDRYRSRITRRELVDAVDDAIIVYDSKTGDVIDVNRIVREDWGYSYERACASTIADLSVSRQPTSDRSIDDWTRGGDGENQPRRFEWAFERRDGTQCWADVRLKRVTDGGTGRTAAIVSETRGSKRKALKLEAFREAVEHAGHSVYITDTSGEIRYVNGAFEEITGYGGDEAIGRTPRLLKSGEHDKAFYRELWSTILDGSIWQNEIVNERKDGTKYVVNQTIAPITDDSGTIVRFVAINAEITDRKQYERRLRTLYEATTEWLESDSSVAVCDVVSDQLTELLEFDLHGVYLYDESSERLEPAAVSKKADTAFEEQPTFRSGEGIAWEVFETGESRRYDDVRTDPNAYNPDTDVRSELILSLGEHGVLMIGSKATNAFDETDEMLAKVLASTLTGVLDRIDREETLREQNSRLKEFASVVSHDLRNPLTIANGHLELALNTGDVGHLEEIERANRRMERIIDDLLWLAREGRRIGTKRSVDLSGVVADAWRNVETSDATLEATCNGIVSADPDRLQQLFENLFRNAIEHGGPSVTVRFDFLPDERGFFVEDDGPGIPPEEREKIVESGYSTSEDGTGYGLSIVRTIVEAHGWELNVTSGSDGGARFECYLDADDIEFSR